MHKNIMKVALLVLVSCCTVSSSFSMYRKPSDIVKEWAPSVVSLTGLAAYTLFFDRQAPAKVLPFVKNNCKFTVKNLLLIGSAGLLGGHMAYEYFKPRTVGTYYYFKNLFRNPSNG